MRLFITLLVFLISFSMVGCGRTSTKRSKVGNSIALHNLGQVIDSATSDLDGDDTTETIAITYKTHENGHPMGGEIVVLQPRQDGSLNPVWRQKRLNPWKLRIADVNGDGKHEIIAGVWKKSPKDPIMAKRTFVYSWNGKRMLPKWLGSRLARRFDDFTLADINSDGWDELLALEVAPKGKHRVSVYRWRCFGFEWLGCSDDMAGLTAISTANGKVVMKLGNHELKVIRKKDGDIALVASAPKEE